MQALIKFRRLLEAEWRQARLLGRLVYLYYALLFIAEIYYVTHLNAVVIGGR